CALPISADGSLGLRGRVTDALPSVIADTRADAVYACGPMESLRAVTAVAMEFDIPVQVAVEEAMACGVGVCMTCVLPVVGDDGVTRMVRSCVDGPVFAGDRCGGTTSARSRPAPGAPRPEVVTDAHDVAPPRFCPLPVGCRHPKPTGTAQNRVGGGGAAVSDVDLTTELAGVTLPNPV